jgi:arabinogalactan oligomer / maltooligosaccharide transport system permease protein
MATTAKPRRVSAYGSGPVTPGSTWRSVVRIIILLIGVIFALYPFLLIISSSFDGSNTLSGQNIFPRQPSLANYNELLNNEQTPVLVWLRNSVLVSGITTVLTLALTTLAAYSFSRYRFKGRQSGLLALVIQVFPSVISLVAFYILLQQIGEQIPFLGLNSLGGLILVYCGGALGSNAWLMKGYFDTIPKEIDEAAQVDGATHWVTFTQIILPLIRPILAVVGILSFIGTFNDFLLPRVLLRTNDNYTLAVGLTTFLDNQFSVNWGVFAAGAMLGTFPIILIFLLLQSQIVGGLSSGAVKG